MYKSIRGLLTTVVLVIALTANVLAAATAHFPYREIESWRDQGMVFVVRNADGEIMHHAKGHLEKWKSETYQVWVVRDSQGRFLTFMHGTLERWGDGSLRLVLRNKEGKFVAIGLVRYENGRPVLMTVDQAASSLPSA
ncbi:MAG: hypothetical protein HY814_01230 [Candidatus Riflebacteria bacterium]|nr:hypothetical protein [Candidatus Riflebacteria bacterium]